MTLRLSQWSRVITIAKHLCNETIVTQKLHLQWQLYLFKIRRWIGSLSFYLVLNKTITCIYKITMVNSIRSLRIYVIYNIDMKVIVIDMVISKIIYVWVCWWAKCSKHNKNMDARWATIEVKEPSIMYVRYQFILHFSFFFTIY